MPLVNRTFSQLINFTRTTAATFVGSNGLIQTTPQSRNLLTFTEEFDNSNWTKTNVTITANSTTAPDGTNTADTMLATAGAGNHHAQQSAATAGNSTLSVFVRAGTSSFVQILMTAGTGTNAWFTAIANLSTGAITQSAAGASASLISSSITNAGGGWYRVSVTGSSTLGVLPRIALVNAASGLTFDGGGNVSWTAAGTETAFIWGAQLEQVPDANLVLGGELVTNGDFSSGTGWIAGAGWSIGSGIATANAGAFSAITQSVTLVAGRTYRVSFDVLSYSGGNVRASFTGGTQVTGSNRAATGQYLVYLTALTGNNTLAVGSDGSGFIGTIDNVTVREITGTTGMPSDYTRNFGGLFPPRFDYDPVTLGPRGLLIEEQRTNLLLRSEEFDNGTWSKLRATVTANSTTAPDGTTTADTLLDTAVAGTHVAIQTTAKAASAITYAASVWLKADVRDQGELRVSDQAGNGVRCTFNLTTAAVGAAATFGTGFTAVSSQISQFANGWYRVVLVATSNTATTIGHEVYIANASGSISYTGTGAGFFVWGAQLEAGAFATSYIPTVASQVTRTADVATIAAPNFASWFNQTEGTLVASVARLAIGTADAISATLFADGNNIIELFAKNTDSRVLSIVGGVTQVNLIDAGKVSASVPYTSGVAYRLNDYALATNAGTVLTDTSATVPTVTILGIGSRSGALPFNGHIRSIRYYPSRLSNTQLQALTA